MSHDPSTYSDRQQARYDKFCRKIDGLKTNLRMTLHAIFWKTLWKTGLAIPYSKFACKYGLYEKFMDGRCMYCGQKEP